MATEAGDKPSPVPPLREVVVTTQFKTDFKREERGPHRTTLRADLQAAVDKLAADVPLPRLMVDHPLGGNWKDHRDCHIKPDLVLIYRKIAVPAVEPPNLAQKPKLRLGSHSELGI